MNLRRITLALAPMVMAAALVRAQPAPAGAPPTVGVITASPQPVYSEQSYVGRIESPQIVQLAARVTGYLVSQNFRDGDQVKQGQLLYVIEQPPYQAAVTQARAAVDQAKAQARDAQLTLERAEALLHTAAGQQSSVDAAEAAALSDSAQIESAEAQLQTAQINLGYTEIRAPLDGQIGATTVNAGNVVGPTTGPLATIVAQDPMYVLFALPVVDALNFRRESATTGGLAGLDLLVQLPDGRIYGQVGKIDFVNNQITQNTDTLTWRGTIANPPLAGGGLPGASRELTDGEFVTVILRARAPAQKIVIPRDAVITDQLGDYVLALGPGDVLTRRNVVQGPVTADSVQIASGIDPGDRIVVDGLQSVHPGMVVDPKPAATN